MPLLTRIRLALALVMLGLVVAGVTAFPLLAELAWLTDRLVGPVGSLDPSDYRGVTAWLLTARAGYADTYAKYPWIAYGTDW